MSSTGASYAHVYVQQKRQKERLRKIEEERAKKVDNHGDVIINVVDDDDHSSVKSGSRNKKVHPGNFVGN